MLRLILLFLFVCYQGAFAVEVNIPSGWSKLEIPTKVPPTIRSILKLVSPEQDSEVSITEMDVVMSISDAEASFIRGASRGGYKHISTSDVTKLGFTGKHLVGEFIVEDGGEPIFSETFILLTPDSMISLGVTGDKAGDLLPEVLNWIEVPQSSSSVHVEEEVTRPRGRSPFEYIGIGLVCVAVGYAIFGKKFKSKST